MASIKLTVNRRSCEVEADPSEVLLDVLRNRLGLLGTKSNCLEAECGVCAVLFDGSVVNSCIVLIGQCEGRSVTTIEGLAESGHLHPVQQAFLDHGAVQCGYCIPGMVLTAVSLLTENSNPTRDEVSEGICGTLCRCTGYQKIVDAIIHAARDSQ